MRALAFERNIALRLFIIHQVIGKSDELNRTTVILVAVLTPHIATVKWPTNTHLLKQVQSIRLQIVRI